MYDRLPRPLLFAHRGASAEAPENTLEAFERAVQHGADVLELDVHLTRDDAVVVFHDHRLERTTQRTGPLAALSLAEVKTLDAGFGFRDALGQHCFRDRGVRVPTLAEVVNAFPGSAFNIELKALNPRLLAAVLDALAPLGNDQVVLAAGKPEVMAMLEAGQPRFPLGMSKAHILDVLKRVWTGRRIPEVYRGRALQIPPKSGALPVATGRVIRAAHAVGLEVHLWTINDAAQARGWLERGVDGIMSDDPGALVGLFAERGTRTSPALERAPD